MSDNDIQELVESSFTVYESTPTEGLLRYRGMIDELLVGRGGKAFWRSNLQFQQWMNDDQRPLSTAEILLAINHHTSEIERLKDMSDELVEARSSNLSAELRNPAYNDESDGHVRLRAADEIDRLTERLAGAYASVNLLTEMHEKAVAEVAELRRERDAWLQVWDNVKLDNPTLREDNKPLAVAACYALLKLEADRMREALVMSVNAMREPFDGWKGEVEALALAAARTALGEQP